MHSRKRLVNKDMCGIHVLVFLRLRRFPAGSNTPTFFALPTMRCNFGVISWLERFKAKVSPEQFVRAILLLTAAWLLGVYPVLNAFFWMKLPKSMQVEGKDFGQYYEGSLAARFGLWQHLYPTPKKEIFERPPVFEPLIKTPFFKPEVANQSGKWFLYPQFASRHASNVAPEILKHCPRLKTDWRFILPPPAAIYLSPLGFFDHRTASNLWFTLMCASFFGTGVLSSRIFRLLTGKATYMEGLISLFPAISTWLGSNMATSLKMGNISPFLGFLIAAIAYAWIRNRQSLIAFGLILLVPFKGIGLNLCPLFVIRPVKWITLGAMTVLAVLINLVTLRLGGAQVYKVFFEEILPKVHSPAGTGLQEMIVLGFGVNPQSFFGVVSPLLVSIFYFGYWRRRDQAGQPAFQSIVLACMAGSISLFCLFNPVVWPHYCITYLFLPFAGWVFWEAFQAQGKWKWCLWIMICLNLFLSLDALVYLRDSLLVELLQRNGLYTNGVDLIRKTINGLAIWILPLFESLFFLVLAYRRVFMKMPASLSVCAEESGAINCSTPQHSSLKKHE